MQLASKHLDVILGVDFHFVNAPTPFILLPHPFIGMVLDIFDYIPFVGSTIHINGKKRSNSGTAGTLITYFHIPFGLGFTLAPLIAHDAVMFFGHKNTVAEGALMSGALFPLMSCQCIGLPLSFNINKVKPKKFKLVPGRYLPLSMSLPIPWGKPVNVGAPLVPDFASAMMRLAAGAVFGFLAKAGIRKIAGKLSKAMSKKGGKMANAGSKLKSAVCRTIGDPVDPSGGRMMVTAEDFNLPGPVPFAWQRFYDTASDYEGPLGYGWHHQYDWELELFPAEGLALLRMEEGRYTALPIPGPGQSYFDREERITLFNDEKGYGVEVHDKLHIYRFANNRLVRIENKTGHAIHFNYKQGLLSSIKDSAGRLLQVTNDKQGRIESILLAGGDEYIPLVNYSYNDDNDLITVTDALDKPTVMIYRQHRMTSRTDRNGVTFNWEYDQQGRCVHTWGPEGKLENNLAYLPGQTIVTNALGHTTQYEFNDAGLVTAEINGLGHKRSYSYNEYNELLTETDELERTTAYAYDEWGNRVAITRPGGGTLNIRYEHFLPVAIKDAANKGVWLWKYNEAGQPLMRIGPTQDVTRYTYEQGLLKTVISPEGQETVLYYDEQYNLVKATLPGHTTTAWQYDALGRCTWLSDSEGNEQRFQFDQQGRLTAHKGADGNQMLLKYDAYDHIIYARDKQYEVSFEYTVLGSLKSRIQNGTKVEFRYDAEEQLRAVRNEAGNFYTFLYDPAGRITEEKSFDGLTRRYHRDPAGQISTLVRPGGKQTRYSYDADGNMIQITYDDGSEEFFSYDSNGLMLEAVNEHGTIQLVRDAAGKVISETQNGFQVLSHYDNTGRRTAITSSLGANINFTYDVMGYVQNVMATMGHRQWTAHIKHNVEGMELERLLPGQVKLCWQYDSINRPLEQQVLSGGQLLRSKSYRWDVNERLSEIFNNITHHGTRFYYDEGGFLNGASHEDGTRQYRVADQTGNIYEEPVQKDRRYGKAGQLLQKGGTSYQYDDEGSLIKKVTAEGKTWRYDWYENGLLKKVVRPDKKEVIFTYDALGRRISKIYEGITTRWVWNGNVVLHEWQEATVSTVNTEGLLEPPTPENLVTWVFEENSHTPMAKLCGEDTFSIICDQLGTPVEMFNTAGKRVWEGITDIYGRIRTITGNRADCPFRYQGQYEDVETGLYYNRFRYYAPEEGLYISADPIGIFGDNPTLYGYADDPNTVIDLFGLSNTAIGDAAEAAFEKALNRYGFKVFTPLKNASQNGVDIIAQHPLTKKIYVFEVKANSSRMTILQKKDSYVKDILNEITRNGTLRKQRVPASVRAEARAILGEIAQHGTVGFAVRYDVVKSGSTYTATFKKILTWCQKA